MNLLKLGGFLSEEADNIFNDIRGLFRVFSQLGGNRERFKVTIREKQQSN
jgi:hypothetical protein